MHHCFVLNAVMSRLIDRWSEWATVTHSYNGQDWLKGNLPVVETEIDGLLRQLVVGEAWVSAVPVVPWESGISGADTSQGHMHTILYREDS